MAASVFVTLGAQHLVALLVSLASGVALVCFVRARRSARLERAVRWTLAMGCLGCLGFMLWTGWSLGFSWQWLLPLHLCDLSLLVATVALLSAGRLAYELLYFWGIGGAVQALLQPNIFAGFPSAECLCFFLAHALVITSALHATVVQQRRPAVLSILRVWLVTNVYGITVFWLNFALGTNYLFIRHKPPTPSLLDLMGEWPYYVAVLDVVALAILALCYVPFLILDWRRGRKG